MACASVRAGEDTNANLSQIDNRTCVPETSEIELSSPLLTTQTAHAYYPSLRGSWLSHRELAMFRRIQGTDYNDFSHLSETDTVEGQEAAKKDQNFPVRLHYMLAEMEKDGLQHIVSWQPHGRCFIVHDQQEFVKSVLPMWFRQTKFTSFQRQLNIYGFTRITAGPDKSAYYHELFLRGKQFLAQRINRLQGGQRKQQSSRSTPNFYLMPPLPPRDHVSVHPQQRASAQPSQALSASFVASAARASNNVSSLHLALQELQGSTRQNTLLQQVDASQSSSSVVEALLARRQLDQSSSRQQPEPLVDEASQSLSSRVEALLACRQLVQGSTQQNPLLQPEPLRDGASQSLSSLVEALSSRHRLEQGVTRQNPLLQLEPLLGGASQSSSSLEALLACRQPEQARLSHPNLSLFSNGAPSASSSRGLLCSLLNMHAEAEPNSTPTYTSSLSESSSSIPTGLAELCAAADSTLAIRALEAATQQRLQQQQSTQLLLWRQLDADNTKQPSNSPL